MISWVREKVAERRAKWSRFRNKDDSTTTGENKNLNNSSSSLEQPTLKSNSKMFVKFQFQFPKSRGDKMFNKFPVFLSPQPSEVSTNGHNPAFPTVPPVTSKTKTSSAESSTSSLGRNTSNNLIRVRVYTKRGRSCQIEIARNLTGHDLKKDAFRKLLFPYRNSCRESDSSRRDGDSLSDLDLYYLIMSKTRRKFDENRCLSELRTNGNKSSLA